MLGKILKWVAIVLGALIGLLVIAYLVIFFVSNGKVNKDYSEVQGVALTIPTDEASIQEGERLIAIRACVDCHESDFGGGLLIDDPMFGTIYSANISSAASSEVASFTPADWDRAIRHGIEPDGKPLAGMPSEDYHRISDEDLAKMIAYLQSVPPVERTQPESKYGPMLRVLVATNQFVFPAESIDHSVRPPVSMKAEVSAEYGGYLATTCTGCHRPDFSGGAIIGTPPDYPPSANLTPAGHLANWTQEDFITTLRTGTTPEGENLNPEYMPWPITERMTDDELSAIWLYLSSLPAVASDN